ncbi:MAG: inositol monophosphatase family protein, partial [Cyanobacteria bacterium P01_H01_bin.121]
QIPNHTGILSGELTGSIMGAGKFIDGAAIAFMAQEAGYITTTLTGQPLPPLHTCTNYQRPSLVIASSPAVHADLLKAGEALLASAT